MSPAADPPAVTGVLETALYVGDLDRSLQFYTALFGFPVLYRDERMAALEVPGRQVLLLFRSGASRVIDLPDGPLPGHDGSGQIHFAFGIDADQLEPWMDRLAARGISLELVKRWPRGGTSVYFRDPDGHLAELATPGLWWPADAEPHAG